LRGDDGGTPVAVTEKQEIDSLAIAYVQPPYSDDYQLLRLAGYVENLSDKPITVASLEFQLLDEDGNKKELIAYDVSDIPAHSRKSFDANAGVISPDRDVQVSIVQLETVE
jgi:hypothetical protein